MNKETKVCPVCGLSFTNRKRWKSRDQWDQVVYCSNKCRTAKKMIKT
ncbi:DUF2256 domain-containing protein [Armatimonas sp.]